MRDEDPIRVIAGENHGCLSRAAALEAGASKARISRLLKTGSWTEVQRGVYYLNATPMTWRSELRASLLAAGPDAVASHRSAARLYRMEGFKWAGIELTVPYDDRPEPTGTVLHRTRRPLPSICVDSLRVTTPERTLLDLAAFLPDPVLEKTLTSSIRSDLTSIRQIDEAIGLFGGRGVTGTRRLRRVLGAVAIDGVTGSPAEVELARVLRKSQLPRPVPQLRIGLPDGTNAYPDFSWPDRMKAVEVDGLGAHSTPEQLQSDLVRQNLLMEAGWQIRRFTARQVRREPALVLSEIERFLAA